MCKPQFPMHGLHFRQSMKHIAIALVLSAAVGVSVHIFHNLPKRERYLNFYTTYDPMKSFNRMMEGGYLDSCPPTPKGKSAK